MSPSGTSAVLELRMLQFWVPGQGGEGRVWQLEAKREGRDNPKSKE